jgi:hypothetical protein
VASQGWYPEPLPEGYQQYRYSGDRAATLRCLGACARLQREMAGLATRVRRGRPDTFVTDITTPTAETLGGAPVAGTGLRVILDTEGRTGTGVARLRGEPRAGPRGVADESETGTAGGVYRACERTPISTRLGLLHEHTSRTVDQMKEHER